MISCLIITPRIRFATPGMSWIGVGLVKLGVVGRDLSPRDFICCEKERSFSMGSSCGNICVSMG